MASISDRRGGLNHTPRNDAVIGNSLSDAIVCDHFDSELRVVISEPGSLALLGVIACGSRYVNDVSDRRRSVGPRRREDAVFLNQLEPVAARERKKGVPI
ncbi:MAG: hypothetical protein AAF710_04190 [Planctomycetota bacterium]